MLKMNYKGETAQHDISFTKYSDNVVTLMGDYPAKTSGFYLNRAGHKDDWDYSEYTTIYKELEGGYMFSNDGSVAPVVEEEIEEEEADGNTSQG